MPFAGRPWSHLWRADDLPDTPGDWPARTPGSPTLALQAGATYTPNQSTTAFPGLGDVDPDLVNEGAAAGFLASGYVWIGTGLVLPGASRIHVRVVGIAAPSAEANPMHWIDAGSSTQQILRVFSRPTNVVGAQLFSGGSSVAAENGPEAAAFVADLVIEPSGSLTLRANGAVRTAALSLTRPDTDGTIRALFRSFGTVLGMGINVGADASWITQGTHEADVTALGLTLIDESGEAPDLPSAPPREIEQGTTAEWLAELAEYTPAAGWSYRWIMSSASTRHEATVVTSGSSWVASFTAAATAGMSPGSYEWRAYVEQGALRYQVGAGVVRVTPSALDAAADLRSANEVALDAIEAVLAGRASRDQEEMTFNGRSIRRMSVDDLMKIRAHYRHVVGEERARAAGRSSSRLITTRFRG